LRERRRVASRYDEALADLEADGRLQRVRQVDEGQSAHHIYAVLVDPAKRAGILQALAREGVQAASHFVPLHASPFGRTLAPGLSLPRTERIAASIVRLPIYPGLGDSEVEAVAAALRRALDS